jgi:uncharacterized protein (TIGR02466 family)
MTEFIDLFPTKFVKRALPDFEGPNRDLIKHVREMEKANKSLTTDYRENNPLEYDREGPNWLRAQINDTVIQYLKNAGIDYPVNWQIHAWANVNRMGDYHDPHNHPHAYLSGTYYLKMPTDAPKKRHRADVRPNHISFYDPRTGFNMTSIKRDPYVDPEFTVLPEPGLLMMWPGSLMHFVHPNLSEETRLSLSFNVVLKWSDDYLPSQ